jgi:FkbM family methyltransferase
MANLEEYIRRCFRHFFAASTYFKLANCYNEICVFFRVGPSQYAHMHKIKNCKAGDAETTVSIKSSDLAHPFYIRLGTTDFGEFCHTVVRRAYRKSLPLHPIKLIIDAGAYIGDSTCWYASQCPDAIIVALEPDPNNFLALTRNVAPYGSRVRAQQSALWHENQQLKIVDGGGGSGMSVRELCAGETPDCLGVSLQTLIGQLSPGGVDIVKLDVEGEEVNLFAVEFDDWIEKAHTIVVDIHSPIAAEKVLQAAARWGRECERYRELYILRKGL